MMSQAAKTRARSSSAVLQLSRTKDISHDSTRENQVGSGERAGHGTGSPLAIHFSLALMECSVEFLQQSMSVLQSLIPVRVCPTSFETRNICTDECVCA